MQHKLFRNKFAKRLATVAVLAILIPACASNVFTQNSNPTARSASSTSVALAPTINSSVTLQVKPGTSDPNEPVSITGDIPYTSPFFLSSAYEPFVMLEDEAGFVQRNKDFVFRLRDQVIGPVEVSPDKKLTYDLALPSVPQGTMIQADPNDKQAKGVQVFAVAYWSNTWNGPFLEQRDGTGWSNAYSSAITDPQRNSEIMGGTLIVWAPDDQQKFPTGFGPDGKLLTADDPVAPIPAGYTLVDLNQTPFRFYKEAQPKITLNEGVIALNDYSKMSYVDAFKAMVDKMSLEYPFTDVKHIDWQGLTKEYLPKMQQAQNTDEFYRAMLDFSHNIPDAHADLSYNPDVFSQEFGGGFGLVLAQLSDGRVIVTNVLPNTPGEQAGMVKGAEIVTWNGKPVADAINQVVPFFGSYSSDFSKHLAQVKYLTRVPVDTQVTVSYKNPGDNQAKQANLKAIAEMNSFFASSPYSNMNELSLPVEATILPNSGLGYIRINTFLDDTNLMAHLWDRDIQTLINNKVSGLIIDMRSNGGGNSGLALNFAGYFFNKEVPLFQTLYYNRNSGKFESQGLPTKIQPAPQYYDGPVAVLVGPYCASACEGFAYAMQQQGRSIVVGNYPSAGGFGDVTRGQFQLPDGISMQFPTGRSETLDGKLVIEGTGVIPDITVPVTADSLLGQADTVLDAAVQAVQSKIKQ